MQSRSTTEKERFEAQVKEFKIFSTNFILQHHDVQVLVQLNMHDLLT